MQGCTFDKVKGKKVWKGDGVVLNDKSYRVFASTESTGAVYKKKDGKNPEKFANCPDNCFIENDSVAGVSTDDYPQLNKQWYIDTTWYRIRQFKGEVK
jgi:DNA polymerase